MSGGKSTETGQELVKLTDYFCCFRYDDLVESTHTLEQVESLAFVTSFLPHSLTDANLEVFFHKLFELIDNGVLNPQKADTEKKLNQILTTLTRICLLKLRKKSYFLQDSASANLVRVLNQFKGYIRNIDPVEMAIVGRILHRSSQPSNLYKELYEELNKVIANEDCRPDIPKAEILYILTKNDTFLARQKYFQAGMENLIESLKTDMDIGKILHIANELRFKSAYDELLEDTIDALSSDIHQLTILVNHEAQATSMPDHLIKKVSDILLLHNKNSNCITSNSTFTKQAVFIIRHAKAPTWFFQKVVDAVPNLDARDLGKIAYVAMKKAPNTFKFKIESEVVKRFFELLDLNEVDMNITNVLRLTTLSTILYHRLTDEQRNHVSTRKNSK